MPTTTIAASGFFCLQAHPLTKKMAARKKDIDKRSGHWYKSVFVSAWKRAYWDAAFRAAV
jgi:hypothetical protein